MTNEEIILKSVQAHLTPAQRHEIAAAAYTPEQIANTVEHIPDGLDELAAAQIHTFGFWKQNGKSVKRGEKALFTCPLWKYTDKPSKAQRDAAEAAGEEAKAHPHYYPTTSYILYYDNLHDQRKHRPPLSRNALLERLPRRQRNE